MELLKHPEDYIVCSDNTDPFNTYRDDRQIINLFRRDGNTTILKIENFKENGELKYFR